MDDACVKLQASDVYFVLAQPQAPANLRFLGDFQAKMLSTVNTVVHDKKTFYLYGTSLQYDPQVSSRKQLGRLRLTEAMMLPFQIQTISSTTRFPPPKI